jgi:hypothetical protein
MQHSLNGKSLQVGLQWIVSRFGDALILLRAPDTNVQRSY